MRELDWKGAIEGWEWGSSGNCLKNNHGRGPMARKSTRWDAIDYLNSEEDIAAYLDAVWADGDFDLLKGALDDIARARKKMATVQVEESQPSLRDRGRQVPGSGTQRSQARPAI